MENETEKPDLELEAARLGIDAETFLRTNLGKYLLERAEMEAANHMVALVQVSPTDVEQNTVLRNKILVCHMFKDWIEEVVEAGQLAYQAISLREAID